MSAQERPIDTVIDFARGQGLPTLADHAAVELAALRAERDELRAAMQEAIDFARTGLQPDTLGLTPGQWCQRKLDKIAAILAAALKDTE